jgi:xanthine/uracil permease
LIYILYYQVVAGMSVAFRSGEGFSLKNSLVIGVPAFVGTVIAFLPTSIFHTVPDTLRPIVGNGFVMGVLSALIMEHLIFKKPRVGN